MKIVGIYYNDFGAGKLPANPMVASTQIHVRTGDESSDEFNFHHQYTFNIMTLGYLREFALESGDNYHYLRSALIVERFDYDLIETAIKSILPDIHFYGILTD